MAVIIKIFALICVQAKAAAGNFLSATTAAAAVYARAAAATAIF